MLSKVFSILLFLSFFTTLLTAQNPIKINWENCQLEIHPSREKYGTDDFKKTSVKIIDSKINKIIFQTEIDFNFIEYKTVTMNQKPVLFIISHSGGESGGTTLIHSFILNQGKIIENKTLETSGYSRIDFADIDKDGSTELILDDFSFQDTQISCFATGLLGIDIEKGPLYPIIYTVKENQLTINTYSKKYRDYLGSFINQTERDFADTKILQPNVQPSENFILIHLMQYYSTLKNINELKRAENFLKNKTLRIICNKRDMNLLQIFKEIIK